MRILEYSEQLQEAFLHLAHAKQQEEQRRQESDAVLAGLSLLLSAKSHDDVIHILHKVFRQLTGSQMCLVMLRQGDMLVDGAANVSLPIGRSFERVLKGGVLNAFDVSQIPEWANAYEQGVKSALHVPLKLSATTGMLILCSPDKHAFPNTLVDLVRRLVPFAEQAVAKMEAIEIEHAQEVEAQQALMRLILDHVSVGIWMQGVDGKMKFINKAFCDALGVTEQQFLSARHYVDVLGENMAKQCMLSDEQCFAEKTLTHSQETFLCVDGEQHVFDVIKVPVFDGDNQVRCLVGIAVDVTDKLNSAREKEDMQRQILHTQKLESLGVLAGGIAHDFNNILTAIMGHASLAEHKTIGNPVAVQDHLQVIVSASEKAADLCKQMLAYSGKGKFIVQPLNVSDLIGSIVNILEVSLHKGVVFKMELQEGLSQIEADASQVQQVVMNLITNANEAIGERSGVVSIRTGSMFVDQDYFQHCMCADDISPGKHVFIEVSDTGCGMDEITMDKMFDPFFSTKFTGRGLGMSAVLGIIRGHHGALKVYSELNKGTTFRILFPAVESAEVQQDGESEVVPQLNHVESVLVVDDEQIIRDMAVMMLHEIGVTEVFTASDGKDALEVYKREQNNVGLVLLDLTMPRMDGEETFAQLRRMNADVKVVLSSGYSESDIQDRFAGKGLYGFIQKPYMSEVLQDMVRKVFDKK